MTGLPFVFAAWVTTSEIDKNFVNEFNKVLDNGVKHVDEAIKESQITHPKNFDPGDYLSNKISYNFDDKKREALQLFLKYISEL
ncbi:MAG: hypothetical protein IPJ32_18280 [Sphingobacteriaceae bacterium]|nr:hypothetical protein [Sphingobacteriaceae bacterium]